MVPWIRSKLFIYIKYVIVNARSAVMSTCACLPRLLDRVYRVALYINLIKMYKPFRCYNYVGWQLLAFTTPRRTLTLTYTQTDTERRRSIFAADLLDWWSQFIVGRFSPNSAQIFLAEITSTRYVFPLEGGFFPNFWCWGSKT